MDMMVDSGIVLIFMKFVNVGVDDEEQAACEGDAGLFLGQGVADAARFAEVQGVVVEGIVEAMCGDVSGVVCERKEGEEVANIAGDGRASGAAQEPAASRTIDDTHGNAVDVGEEEDVGNSVVKTRTAECAEEGDAGCPMLYGDSDRQFGIGFVLFDGSLNDLAVRGPQLL